METCIYFLIWKIIDYQTSYLMNRFESCVTNCTISRKTRQSVFIDMLERHNFLCMTWKVSRHLHVSIWHTFIEPSFDSLAILSFPSQSPDNCVDIPNENFTILKASYKLIVAKRKRRNTIAVSLFLPKQCNDLIKASLLNLNVFFSNILRSLISIKPSRKPHAIRCLSYLINIKVRKKL